jgi:hypothetical protein
MSLNGKENMYISIRLVCINVLKALSLIVLRYLFYPNVVNACISV